MTYNIRNFYTGELIEEEAAVTPFLLSDSKSQFAVKRNGVWIATDYPGFVLKPGEAATRIRIEECR